MHHWMFRAGFTCLQSLSAAFAAAAFAATDVIPSQTSIDSASREMGTNSRVFRFSVGRELLLSGGRQRCSAANGLDVLVQ